jgi:hypothetical protein
MPRTTSASLKWIIPSAILLPLFGYLAISMASHGDWLGASLVAGMWIFFTLLATNLLFQALTVFGFSMLALSQHKFGIGLVGMGSIVYLFLAKRGSQPRKEPVNGAGQANAQLPTGLLETIASPGFALWLMVVLALFGIAIGFLFLVKR